MNYKAILNTLGKVLILESILLLIPLITGIIYSEQVIYSYIITIGICLVIGLLLTLLIRPNKKTIYSREGILIAALSWILISLIGAVPFTISGEVPSYIDGIFESVSGFTTTGASIIDNVETISRASMMWRSLTHWVGGMGVLVFIIAIANSSSRPINVLKAEMPGPTVDKIKPKSDESAKILYLLYIGLTVLEVVFLCFGDMNFFESIVHSFATAGTGGFGIKCDSVGSYSTYSQIVIAVFMFLFGINFNLYYLLLLKNFKKFFRNTELIVYVGLVVTSVIIISINIYSLYQNIGQTISLAFFQVSSIITTTGFSTCDFNTWPTLSKAILFILMFIGGCAGSTAGGLKVSRVVILFKRIKRQFRSVIHPKAVEIIKLDGKKLDDETINSTTAYFSIYMIVLAVLFLLLCIVNATTSYDLISNLSATVACFNNIGPGFEMVGPMSSFAGYNGLSKIILSIAMLLGRLEIYPLLLVCIPSTWTKKK